MEWQDICRVYTVQVIRWWGGKQVEMGDEMGGTCNTYGEIKAAGKAVVGIPQNEETTG